LRKESAAMAIQAERAFALKKSFGITGWRML
jgi:hypothetical protein